MTDKGLRGVSLQKVLAIIGLGAGIGLLVYLGMVFDRLATLIGLVTDLLGLGVFFYASVQLLQARAEYTRYLERQSERTERPWALAVGVMGVDITESVRNYLSQHDLEMPIEPYVQSRVTSENFNQILRDILKITKHFLQADVTEVHLFYMGTVTLAAGIGAIVSNWFPTKLYNYDRGNGGTFVLHGIIDKAVTKGLVEGGISDAERNLLDT